jgi:TonB family protein
MDEPSPKTNGSAGEADSQASGKLVSCPSTKSDAKTNLAGLAARTQRAEMRVLLAGKWPALKPLPIFKYENAVYRAAIDFDKLRGEWVCRKIAFPSNKIQELRGALTELTRALPAGAAEATGEDGAAGEAEEELPKDAARRASAMAEWRAKSESGALYSELESYLSKSQREEIYEIIRLTLTARQLQFIVKNVAYVFDALSKAGGRLATLVEIGQKKKAGQAVDLEEPARESEPPPAKSFAAAVGGGWAAHGEGIVSAIPSAFEKLPSAAMGSVLPGWEDGSLPEMAGGILHGGSRAAEIVTPEILAPQTVRPEFADAEPALPPLAEQLREIGDALKRAPAVDHGRIPLFGFGRARTAGADMSEEHIPGPASRRFVLEISGFHVAAFSVMVLFAAVSLTVGLTVGGESFGKRLRDVVRSTAVKDGVSPPVINDPGSASGDAATRNSSNGDKVDKAKDGTEVESEEKPKGNDAGPESFAKAPAVDPAPTDPNASSTIAPRVPVTPVVPDDRAASSEDHAASGGVAHDAGRRTSAKPGHLVKAMVPLNGAAKNPAERRVMSTNGAAGHVSTPGTILVRGPGDGSKPFRLTLPEKTIAASRTFAMAAQLSVMVAPMPWSAARLQAGGIVSYVWPRYPQVGDRHAAAETVKVRTTIGTSGQVEEIKLLSGSAALFSAASSAIRQWRFKPTLLDERPVSAQEDVTIAFRR